MFAIQNGLRTTSRLSGVIARNSGKTAIVAAPPKEKISSGEQVVALFMLGGAILFAPMYFAPRFKKYANKG